MSFDTTARIRMLMMRKMTVARRRMDADDWLKSLEKKLQVVQCNNSEKVLQASY
jgi:hypothetical protein